MHIGEPARIPFTMPEMPIEFDKAVEVIGAVYLTGRAKAK